MYIFYNYEQEINDPVIVHAIPGVLTTGDHNGQQINIDLFQNGSPYAPTIDSVMGYVIRADGVSYTIPGGSTGNRVWFRLTQAALRVSGRLQMAVKVVAGASTTTVFAAVATVRRSETDTIGTDIIVPSLSDLLAQLDAMQIASNRCNAAADNANRAAASTEAAVEACNSAASFASSAGDRAEQAIEEAKSIEAIAKTWHRNYLTAAAPEKANVGDFWTQSSGIRQWGSIGTNWSNMTGTWGSYNAMTDCTIYIWNGAEWIRLLQTA